MGAHVSLPPKGGQQWHLLIFPCPPNPIDEQAVVASMPHVTISQWYCLHLLYVAHWLFLRYVLSAEHERLADIGCCQRYSINSDHTHVWHPPLLIGTPHYVMIPSDWSSMRPWLLWLVLNATMMAWHCNSYYHFWRVISSSHFKKDVYISNKVLVGLKCPTSQLTPLYPPDMR